MDTVINIWFVSLEANSFYFICLRFQILILDGGKSTRELRRRKGVPWNFTESIEAQAGHEQHWYRPIQTKIPSATKWKSNYATRILKRNCWIRWKQSRLWNKYKPKQRKTVTLIKLNENMWIDAALNSWSPTPWRTSTSLPLHTNQISPVLRAVAFCAVIMS